MAARRDGAKVAHPEIGDRARAVRATWAAIRRGHVRHPGRRTRVRCVEWLHHLSESGYAIVEATFVDRERDEEHAAGRVMLWADGDEPPTFLPAKAYL